jgi:hypothetical protein
LDTCFRRACFPALLRKPRKIKRQPFWRTCLPAIQRAHMQGTSAGVFRDSEILFRPNETEVPTNDEFWMSSAHLTD